MVFLAILYHAAFISLTIERRDAKLQEIFCA